jgi:hypothetical protein
MMMESFMPGRPDEHGLQASKKAGCVAAGNRGCTGNSVRKCRKNKATFFDGSF